MTAIVLPSLADFLEWERDQPSRFEFDGTQPIPMTGGTVAHARLVRRIMEALSRLLGPGFEAFGGDLKVLTAPSRVRYPDVLVLSGAPAPNADTVEPIVVFEVLSSSTALTDPRVKPAEYAAVVSLMAYVILPRETADDATILRRSNGWEPEAVGATLELPEIGVSMPVAPLYRS